MKKSNETLTAAEGAAQAAERDQRGKGQNLPPSPNFHCEGCGHDEFIVSDKCVVRKVTTWAAPCECGAAAKSGVGTWVRHASVCDDYVLTDAHRLEFLDREILEQWKNDDDDDHEVECGNCFYDVDIEDYEQLDEKETEDDHEYSVRCGRCGREIEFGWRGQPDDEAIFPVEAADFFDPVDTRPDEKYEEAWRERGWARS